METRTKIILFTIILLTGVVVGRMVRPSPPLALISPQYPLSPQQNSSGNVTVSVTPLSLKAGLPPSFDVSFETHSVELDFDVESVATFSDGTGAAFTARWEGTPPGGHHRSGTLRFVPDLQTTDTLALTFTGVAGIPERTFSWEVKQ